MNRTRNKLRTSALTAVAAVAAPALMLATAGTAQAEDPLSWDPWPGVGLQVHAKNTWGFDSSCHYDASPVNKQALLLPYHYEFNLPANGKHDWPIFGIPIGVEWFVQMKCWDAQDPNIVRAYVSRVKAF